ncbi:MAG: TatD family hydrolase [Pirellulaceae bacterium]
MIETDAPYLTPEPFRGKRPCEPHHVLHTATCLAETRKMTLSQFAEQTTENAIRRFKIDA